MNDQGQGSPSDNVTCEKCNELLIEFTHDELSRKVYVSVAAHLSTCSSCALQFCQLRADLDGIVHAYTEPVPSHLRSAVRRRVLAKIQTPWWHRLGRLFLQPVPAYSALGLAMIPALLWAGSSIQSNPPPATLSEERAANGFVSSDIRIDDYDASGTLQPSETMY